MAAPADRRRSHSDLDTAKVWKPFSQFCVYGKGCALVQRKGVHSCGSIEELEGGIPYLEAGAEMSSELFGANACWR